jgi:large conductance mechanosensitive channel
MLICDNMGIISEFKEFLNEYKVVGLAVAFIIGAAVTTLVKSLVDNIIMPFVGVVLPEGSWQTATIALGPVTLGVGPFIAELINFIIIALVVFLIAKMVLKEEKVTKK